MRRAEADAATDESERERLIQEATEAEALADVLAGRATDLQTADEARAVWLAHTAETRAAADRARLELSARAVDAEPVETVTAREWLDAHNQHMAEEDAHREITAEHDLTDVVEQRADDMDTVAANTVDEAGETGIADLREVAAEEPAVVESDEVRVPSADEAADTIAHMQRALREIQAREVAEAQRAAEEAQVAELYRRHTVDATEAAAQVDEDAAVAR